MSARRLGFRIVEEQPDISMKCPLVALEGHDVVAVLIDDPPGDVALTIEGIDGHDRSLQRQHLQQPAVISLDFASVAICARTRRWSQPQAVTICNADLPLAVSKERRSVDSNDTLGGFGKPRHEALKAGAELV